MAAEPIGLAALGELGLLTAAVGRVIENVLDCVDFSLTCSEPSSLVSMTRMPSWQGSTLK